MVVVDNLNNIRRICHKYQYMLSKYQLQKLPYCKNWSIAVSIWMVVKTVQMFTISIQWVTPRLKYCHMIRLIPDLTIR